MVDVACFTDHDFIQQLVVACLSPFCFNICIFRAAVGPNFVDKLGRLIERMVPFVVIPQSVNCDRNDGMGVNHEIRAQNEQESPANCLPSPFSAGKLSPALPVPPHVDDTCGVNGFSPRFPKVLG